MRKTLNNNPLIALVVIGILGIGVAFMLLSGMSKGGSSSSSTTSTTSTSATGATTTPATTAGTTAAPTSTTTAPAVAPTDATGATAPTATPATPTQPVGAFVAGPGLPAPIANAYHRGEVVALLITKRDGIVDRDVRRGFHLIQAIPGVAAFTTSSRHVARYSRIAEGVNLDRVPAMIVVRPRSKPAPGKDAKASVTYGFATPAALVQAVRDALYHGPGHLPYHPR